MDKFKNMLHKAGAALLEFAGTVWNACYKMWQKIISLWKKIPHKKWIFSGLGVVLLAAAIIVILIFTLPNNNPADYLTYYGITEEDTLVYLNTERVDVDVCIRDGEIYVPARFVISELNQRFYYDQETDGILYALPDTLLTFKAEVDTYLKDEESIKADKMPMILENAEYYLRLSLVEEYTKLQFAYLEGPNRLWIWNQYEDEVTFAKTIDKTKVRTGASIKEPVLVTENSGSRVVKLSEEGDWWHVFTEDGHVGYVKTSDLTDMGDVIPVNTVYQEQVYYSSEIEGSLSMGWDYIDNVSYGLDMLKQHLENERDVNIIIPTWFVLYGADGDFTSCADKAYVELAHENDIQVFAMIENMTGGCDTEALLKSQKARRHLIDGLVSQVKENEIDGINLDFEGMSAEVNVHYMQFVRELSRVCGQEGIILSVDTMAPYSWNERYNLPELSKIADYIIIMGYDESWDTPGPNSDTEFITFCCEESLKYVPADRLIIGIPFYTRAWSLKDDGTYRREEVKMKKSMELLANCKNVEWLDDKGCYHGTFTEDGIEKEIWFEDLRSMEERLKIISSNGVKGVSAWRLSMENSGTWSLIREYILNE